MQPNLAAIESWNVCYVKYLEMYVSSVRTAMLVVFIDEGKHLYADIKLNTCIFPIILVNTQYGVLQ